MALRKLVYIPRYDFTFYRDTKTGDIRNCKGKYQKQTFDEAMPVTYPRPLFEYVALNYQIETAQQLVQAILMETSEEEGREEVRQSDRLKQFKNAVQAMEITNTQIVVAVMILPDDAPADAVENWIIHGYDDGGVCKILERFTSNQSVETVLNKLGSVVAQK
jgi:hypothetical protein